MGTANAPGSSGPNLPPSWLGIAVLGLVGLVLVLADLSSVTRTIEPPEAEPRLVTNAGAVVCRTPFQLRKAIIAGHLGDGARVLELECRQPGPGVLVRIISQTIPLNGPWEIQLIENDGISPGVWTYAQDLRVSDQETFAK